MAIFLAFVAGTMVIPFAYIVMWVSIFGNAALDRVRGGDADFAAAAQDVSFGDDLMYFGEDGKPVMMPKPDGPATIRHNPYRTDKGQSLSGLNLQMEAVDQGGAHRRKPEAEVVDADRT